MEERFYYLYRHIRLDKNEPFYIGVGIKPIKEPSTLLKEYPRAYTNFTRSKEWYFITNKTEYLVEIIFENNNEKEIKLKEIEFIKLYGRRDLGAGTLVNHTDGGDGILNPSKETRQLMRSNNLGKRPSEETKRKMSILLKEAYRNGKRKTSEETRKKLRDCNLGKKLSKETKKKISDHNLGKKLSKETRVKISNTLKERVKLKLKK